MATIYEHIQQNKRRTVLLVLLFPVLFALLTWGVFALVFFTIGGDPYATVSEFQATDHLTRLNELMLWVLPICWGLAMVWILVSYYTGDQLLLNSVNAIPVTAYDQPEIYRLVENLCISRGLPTPKIYILNDNALNAFATGRDPEHASIALTKGIVTRLERVELEGVIAHELAHVENRDIRLMLITVAGISFFTFMGEICFRLALSSSRSRRSDRSSGSAGLLFLVLGFVCMIYGYVIAPLLRLAVSRAREYQADATAALTTRNPRALASALKKISVCPRVEAIEEHSSMAGMCIESPVGPLGMGLFGAMSGLTSTHPPVEKRIQALLEMDRGI
ncbi:MAG: M48 family metallopeptidase [Elusimicrobia bacterium]|nr:M48 family metallopeptidase [Elusimicrobiota bacterium]MDY5729720.1 M48 family metallopeptidase [Elusimicrobiaceae bacterium]